MIAAGATVYLVGGAIRNYFLDYPINDLDFEVYNLSYERILELVEEKDYYANDKFKTVSFDQIELALPRIEYKTGSSYQDYALDFPKDISVKQALRRRDFTINALMYNLNNNRLVDHCHGLLDLSLQRLKAVNIKTYNEDPTRILRLLKYQANYDLVIESVTLRESKKLAKALFKQPTDLTTKYFNSIINGEFFDVDIFFTVLYDFLEASKLKKRISKSKHHPEKSLYNHIKGTLLSLRLLDLTNKRDYRILFWTLLFHDYGKLTASKNHELYSLDYFKKWQPFVINKQKDILLIESLIEDHMKIREYAKRNDYKKMKELKTKYRNQFYLLEYVGICDYAGRVIDFNQQEIIERMKSYQNDIIKKYKELDYE